MNGLNKKIIANTLSATLWISGLGGALYWDYKLGNSRIKPEETFGLIKDESGGHFGFTKETPSLENKGLLDYDTQKGLGLYGILALMTLTGAGLTVVDNKFRDEKSKGPRL